MYHSLGGGVMDESNAHTSSVERFSENFNQEVVTYFIFSLERTDFKNVIFEKIP